jgi:hypothetical protein
MYQDRHAGEEKSERGRTLRLGRHFACRMAAKWVELLNSRRSEGQRHS